MIPCIKKLKDCVAGDLICATIDGGLLREPSVWRVLNYSGRVLTFELYYTQVNRLRICLGEEYSLYYPENHEFLVIGSDINF